MQLHKWNSNSLQFDSVMAATMKVTITLLNGISSPCHIRGQTTKYKFDRRSKKQIFRELPSWLQMNYSRYQILIAIKGSLSHSQNHVTCQYHQPDHSFQLKSSLILFKIYFNSTFVFQMVSFHQVSPPNPICILLLCHTYYIPYTSPCPWFDHPNNIC